MPSSSRQTLLRWRNKFPPKRVGPIARRQLSSHFRCWLQGCHCFRFSDGGGGGGCRCRCRCINHWRLMMLAGALKDGETISPFEPAGVVRSVALARPYTHPMCLEHKHITQHLVSLVALKQLVVVMKIFCLYGHFCPLQAYLSPASPPRVCQCAPTILFHVPLLGCWGTSNFTSPLPRLWYQ